MFLGSRIPGSQFFARLAATLLTPGSLTGLDPLDPASPICFLSSLYSKLRLVVPVSKIDGVVACFLPFSDHKKKSPEIGVWPFRVAHICLTPVCGKKHVANDILIIA